MLSLLSKGKPLSDLLKALTPLGLRVCGNAREEPMIDMVTSDSRRALVGSIFVAIVGGKMDGHQFVEAALMAGASAVVMQRGVRSVDAPAHVCVVEVSDSRKALAWLSAALYGPLMAPLSEHVMGVTGTNGKTTTTYLVEAILQAAGYQPAVLGTISYRLGQTIYPAPLTTPSSELLWETILRMQREGASHLVMEVSSHSLDQHRVDGLPYRIAGFTNLTQDHLDYHQTMDAYLAAKCRLFGELLQANGVAILNADDPAHAVLAKASRGQEVWTYSQDAHSKAMLVVEEKRVFIDGIMARFATPAGEVKVESPMLGAFNVSNLLLATGMALAAGIPVSVVEAGIANMRAVPGRMEAVSHPLGFRIVVDYAHTPDALEQIIKSLRPLCRGRLIVVFGCGGDRDKSKRPIMGGIVSQSVDISIVTSDNPRTEEPQSIIDQIVEGVTPHQRLFTQMPVDLDEKGYLVSLDRAKAIQWAVDIAQDGDVVLIAGKGHETYQIVGTVQYPFDDREIAKRAVMRRLQGDSKTTEVSG